MLAQGGAPIDAAIAAQMVLGLAEPQSSGLGGGTLILYWDQAARKLTSYDGLAAAPSNATAGLNVDVDGTPLPSGAVNRGGRSVGIPGTLAVLHRCTSASANCPGPRCSSPPSNGRAGYPMQAYLHNVCRRRAPPPISGHGALYAPMAR